MRTVVLHEGVEYRIYDHLYAVSADGRFLKLRGLTTATPVKRPDGYLSVGRRRLAHRMVAACWLEKPNEARHVHHINHDRADNRAANLEWLTPKEHFGDRHTGQGRFERTEATRKKLREYRLGRKTSDETKAKQRAASLRLGTVPPPRPLGYKCSDEARAKMRENSPNAAPCEIAGVVYRSFSEAGRALGMKPHTLRKRCLSVSFPAYRLLE